MNRSGLFTAISLLLLAPLKGETGTIVFNRDIKPILAENCFHCHGPDPGSRKADLRLDREAGFFEAREDGPTIVKGDPDKSPLFQRLITKDEDDVMPPPDSHNQLEPEEIEMMRKWIAAGAPWQPHWSFLAATRPPAPEPAKKDWAKNAIDQFILQRLEKEGLTPEPEADRRTLARRAALDLTGLPPSPELLESFLSNQAPDAYEKYVDQLMALPTYGEHRARYWLDAARYADTHGLHFDNYREIWPYRDWVIKAFNGNMPFDQFTIEQFAGDLLPNPTNDQKIATGFQRCNITTNEGGTIAEENLFGYARDRVETTSWVWLGLTANCAVCHDHKFDPIEMKDFYSMSAYFRNTTQSDKDGNAKDTAPILILPKEGPDAERWAVIDTEIATAKAAIQNREKEIAEAFQAWVANTKPEQLENPDATKDLLLHLPLNEGSGDEVKSSGTPANTTFRSTAPLEWMTTDRGPSPKFNANANIDLGALGDFEKNQAFSYGAWVRVSPDKADQHVGMITRMDATKAYRGWDLFQSGNEFAVHIIDQWPENGLRVSTTGGQVKPDSWQHVFATYDGSGKAAGVKIFVNGKESPVRIDTDKLKADATIKTTVPLRLGTRTGEQPFVNGSLLGVQLFGRKLEPNEIGMMVQLPLLKSYLTKTPEQRTPEETKEVAAYHRSLDQSIAAAQSSLAALEAEKKGIRDRAHVAHIQEEKPNSMPMANIYFRGQYDQPREEVGPSIFQALHPLPENAPKNRLGLAQWLVAADNPLTNRVTVNRMWQELFGTGMVATSEDFGIMGETPSHPELLDWLAVEFRESGWNMKHMIRLMITSAAYRQSAVVSKEKYEKDPGNRLLARGPRFRMDAEMVRDYALAASGLLSPVIGGPSVKPYQPEGVWEAVAMPESNTRNYKQDTGESLYRRSMYTFWKRAAPPASLETLNAPNREVSCLRRERTNTPLQALVTLNDIQFVEAARALAQVAWTESKGETNAMIESISRRLLMRPFRSEERTVIDASLEQYLTYYKSNAADAQALLHVGESKFDQSVDMSALAAWTMLCNQLMNLDEVLVK